LERERREKALEEERILWREKEKKRYYTLR
jgi:hypothetical protein